MADPVAPNVVTVKSPYGDLGTIDQAHLPEALQRGFTVPNNQEIVNYNNHVTYGEGFGNMAKAFGAGVLRGPTFGLSDQAMAKSGLVDPETLNQLKVQNPGSSLAGELTGVGASLLVAPEAEAIGAAREGLTAAKAGGEAAEVAGAKAALGGAKQAYGNTLVVGDALNPVSALSKVTGQIGEHVAPLIGNPENAGIISRVLAGGAAHGLGSMVEGAAYGLGQGVSEDALGDPHALGENLLSHIGFGALIGGALGGALGSAGEAIKPALKINSFVPEADQAAIEAGDLSAIVKNSTAPTEEKAGLIAGLRELKPNASEIKSAAEQIGGAPILEGQLSANKLVQRAEDALLNGPPTIASAARQNMAKQGFDIAEKAVNDQMGDLVHPMSEAEVGNTIKDSLTGKMEADKGVFNDLYGEIKTQFQTVPVSPRAINAVSRNILKIDEQLGKIAPNSSQYKFLQTLSERLQNVETVDDLKRLSSLMNDDLKKLGEATPEMKRLGAIVGEKLKNLEQSTLVRFAEEKMSNQPKVASLLALRHQANDMYRDFMTKAGDLAQGLGKKRVHGPADMIDFIDNMNPQTLAKKLFNERNVEFMQSFSKNFPEEWEAMRNYQMGQIRIDASKKGFFDIRRALKTINEMQPEARELLFTKDQLKKINAADTYVKSFPQSFNPSGTAHEQVLRHSFEQGAIGAIKANVRDFAIQKFIQAATPLENQAQTAKLALVERMSQTTSNAIKQGTSAVFRVGSKASELEGYAGAKLAPTNSDLKANKKKDHKDLMASLNEYAGNPEKLIDTLDQSTQILYQAAPKTTQALQTSTARATQFLASKVPNMPKTPMGMPYQPSQAEVSKFNKYLNTVEDPVSILKHVKFGTLTSEHLEAVSTVFPKLYGEMQTQLIDELTNHMSKKNKQMIPYRTRMALGMFLNQDLDGSTNGALILSNQGALGGQAQAQSEMDKQVKTSQAGLSKVSLATRSLTGMQSVAQRE